MTAWSRRLRSFGWTLRGSASQALRDFRGYKLNEINVPFEQNLEFDVSDRTPRINLVLLGIQSRNMFGGGATALQFLGAIEPSFERCRIIVTGEREDDFESDAWPDWTLESRGTAASRVIAFPSSAKFVVRPGDRFVATHWRTAYFLSALRKIQSEHGGIRPDNQRLSDSGFRARFLSLGVKLRSGGLDLPPERADGSRLQHGLAQGVLR